MLHFNREANVRNGVLLKYCSFIKFKRPPILQGKIHGTELPELGFGLNFLYWGALATHLPGFDDVPGVGTWHLNFQVPLSLWNLMKEQYLSKTPFLRFVYLSKCKINLPCIVGNSQISFFMNGSSVH